MSHDGRPDNCPSRLESPRPPPTPRRRFPATFALIVAGVAWLATMGQVLRSEVLQRRESADVRALVDSARLSQTHASATYAIRLGSATVGSLSSTVSGGQHDEQLAYVIEGQLSTPQDVRVKGVVLAGWDRRPERLMLEATIGGERHRLEGTLRDDPATEGTLFELRYVPPPGGAPREGNWVLPEAPVLAPGPLPIPEFPGSPGESSADVPLSHGRGPTAGADVPPAEGVAADPMTGGPLSWRMTTSHLETLDVAGREREVRRHDVTLGAWQASAWTEPSGFPVRLELPAWSVVVELVDEKR
jgi:hypothetical protein